jgi:DNA invertase Pin-like site-specific DNA recombinase
LFTIAFPPADRVEAASGFDAQRQAVAQFVGADQLTAKFTDIESGKRHNNRPQLGAALAECKKRRLTLVIAKLDRLANRNGKLTSTVKITLVWECPVDRRK